MCEVCDDIEKIKRHLARMSIEAGMDHVTDLIRFVIRKQLAGGEPIAVSIFLQPESPEERQTHHTTERRQ